MKCDNCGERLTVADLGRYHVCTPNLRQPLTAYSTAELVMELQKRAGVMVDIARPEDRYSVDAGQTGHSGSGPAIILTVID